MSYLVTYSEKIRTQLHHIDTIGLGFLTNLLKHKQNLLHLNHQGWVLSLPTSGSSCEVSGFETNKLNYNVLLKKNMNPAMMSNTVWCNWTFKAVTEITTYVVPIPFQVFGISQNSLLLLLVLVSVSWTNDNVDTIIKITCIQTIKLDRIIKWLWKLKHSERKKCFMTHTYTVIKTVKYSHCYSSLYYIIIIST